MTLIFVQFQIKKYAYLKTQNETFHFLKKNSNKIKTVVAIGYTDANFENGL